MVRTLTLLVALVVAVAGCGGGSKTTTGGGQPSTSQSASTDSGGGDCKAGVKDLGGGIQARTFCGPAKASVQAGTSQLSFTGGECQIDPNYVAVNIGTIVLGTGEAANTQWKKFAYFGLLVGQSPGGSEPPAGKDGTYSGGTVTYNDHGTGVNGVQMSITLSNGRQAGSFTGKTFDGKAFTGSWTC